MSGLLNAVPQTLKRRADRPLHKETSAAGIAALAPFKPELDQDGATVKTATLAL
jgi:hypothetical protein